jgi:hypothetical protein
MFRTFALLYVHFIYIFDTLASTTDIIPTLNKSSMNFQQASELLCTKRPFSNGKACRARATSSDSNAHLLGMGEPSATAGSTSSDYFEPEDPAFNEALQNTVLPGDVENVSQVDAAPGDYADPIRTQHTLKRSHSMVEDPDETLSSHHAIPLEERQGLSDKDEETYGASTFGGFAQYMRRKRAKLQIQNAQMDDTVEKSSEKSRIFQGIAIYVRAYPSGAGVLSG